MVFLTWFDFLSLILHQAFNFCPAAFLFTLGHILCEECINQVLSKFDVILTINMHSSFVQKKLISSLIYFPNFLWFLISFYFLKVCPVCRTRVDVDRLVSHSFIIVIVIFIFVLLFLLLLSLLLLLFYLHYYYYCYCYNYFYENIFVYVASFNYYQSASWRNSKVR